MDKYILNWIQENQTHLLNLNFINITALGSTTIIILALVIAYMSLIIQKEYTKAWMLIKVALLCLITVEMIKYTVDRPRPIIQNQIIETPNEPSFPSAHAAFSMCVFLSLAFCSQRVYFYIVAFLLAILVGISRMYLGVHYFTDVACGWIIGLLIFCFERENYGKVV